MLNTAGKDIAAQDTDSTAVVGWKVITASIHDGIIAFPMIDTFRDHEYVIMDAAYDSSGICGYLFEDTCHPVIDTNRRRGIVPDNLTFNSRQGIIIRKREKARHRLR